MKRRFGKAVGLSAVGVALLVTAWAQAAAPTTRPAWGQAAATAPTTRPVKAARSNRRDESLPANLHLLLQVADAYERNLAGIGTWRGSVEIVYRSSIAGNKIKDRLVKAKVKFAFDWAHRSTRWNWATYEDSSAADPKPTLKAPEMLTAMRRPDGFYRATRRGRKPRQARYGPPTRVEIKPLGGDRMVHHADYGRDFDPMWYLMYPDWGDGGHAARLRFLARHAGSMKGWRVMRDGDVVHVVYGDGRLVNLYAFDLSKGGNLVLYHGRDGSGMGRYEWTYEFLGGVWVAKSFDQARVRANPGEPPGTSLLKVSFATNAVNKPMDPSEFSLAAMGVRPGVSIIDYRSTPPKTTRSAAPAREPGPPALHRPEVDPRDVARKFLGGIMAGRAHEAAGLMLHGGGLSGRVFEKWRKTYDLSHARIEKFYLANRCARAVSSFLPKAEGAGKAALGIRLQVHLGEWIVLGTELLPHEEAVREFVANFRKGSPEAKEVLASPPATPSG